MVEEAAAGEVAIELGEDVDDVQQEVPGNGANSSATNVDWVEEVPRLNPNHSTTTRSVATVKAQRPFSGRTTSPSMASLESSLP